MFHINASIVTYAILFCVPAEQCWLRLFLLQHNLLHWANKASIHPSVRVQLPCPFLFPQLLSFRSDSNLSIQCCCKIPTVTQMSWESERDQYGREKESVFTLLFLWNIYLQSPSALHLLHVCMSSCTPNSFRCMCVCEWEIHSEVHLCLSIFCISMQMCVLFICMDLL